MNLFFKRVFGFFFIFISLYFVASAVVDSPAKVSDASKNSLNSNEKGFFLNFLETSSIDFRKLILNDNVLSFFYFIFILVATYFLILMLINRIFRNNFYGNTSKTSKVISLMFSFISTTGLFYSISSTSNEGFSKSIVLLFSSGFSTFLVLIFIILFMSLFVNFSNSVRDEEGALGYGSKSIAILVVGVLFSTYFLLSYTNVVLDNFGCYDKVKGEIKDESSCSAPKYIFFLSSFSAQFFNFILVIAIIFGVFGSFFGGSNNDSSENLSDSNEDEPDQSLLDLVESINNLERAISSASNEFREQSRILRDIRNLIGGNNGVNH